MSSPNNPPRPAEPPRSEGDELPRLEGTLTAEDIEEMLRDGVTFADLIRDIESMD